MGANTPFMPARALGAPHTTSTVPPPVIDRAQGEAVSVRMRPRGDHAADDERRERRRAVHRRLHLEAEHGQAFGDLVEARAGFEILLQPAERELHRLRPWPRVGTSSAAKP